MILVNTDFVSGKEVETIQVVKGSVILSKHIDKDIMASFKTMVGRELTEYSKMINEARAMATKRMVEEAESLGADGVINIRYASSAVMQGAVELTVYGTAVKLKQRPAADIWTAAATGNIEVIKQHLAIETNLDAREPSGGSTPLMVAALLGQSEAVGLLIENGVKMSARNNEGSTALHIAAFFAHPETTSLLLEKGADVNVKNNKGQTPLDIVEGEWTTELEGTYKYIAAVLRIQLDLNRIRAFRPKVSSLLRKHGCKKIE